MSKQALEGSRLNAFHMDPDKLTIIGIDTNDGPEHRLYDKTLRHEIDENFIESLKLYGNITPIEVEKDGDQVLVIDGRRRVLHVRELNRRLREAGVVELQRVKVMAPKRVEEYEALGALIAANAHRMQDSPMENARKLVRFLNLGRSEQEAAVTFNVTLTTVKIWLKLVDLDKSVQAAVDDGTIAATTAAQVFAPMPRAKQKEKLSELLTTTATASPAPATPNGQDNTAAPVAKPKRISASAAKKNLAGSSASKAPGRQLIRRIAEEGSLILDKEVLAVLKWVVGEGGVPESLKDLVNDGPSTDNTANADGETPASESNW
jgi:hypothetical protein